MIALFGGGANVLDSKALTRFQALILGAIILVAAAAGSATFFLLNSQDQSSNIIKIGIFADLDMEAGRSTWQGAILAAEQINAEGGILGRQIEVVAEDNDVETNLDTQIFISALNRLITYHKADFIIGLLPDAVGFLGQDIIADHKKIFFAVTGTADELTQRVIDNYDRYKYFFRLMWNNTSIFQGITDSMQLLSEKTEFTKVGYLAEDEPWTRGVMAGLDVVLPMMYGFEIVYKGTYPLDTFDFSSYFAAAEEAGTEILIPISSRQEGIPLVKEWYDRQSPMVIYSGSLFAAADPRSWEYTDGKCEYVGVSQVPIVAGYPMTNKTLPTREIYFNRWSEPIGILSAMAYDILGIILRDAIERAGTIETEAVIRSLEETSIETSQARNFVFTTSHDVMMGENPNNPEADYMLVCVFQWQNGELIPVHPKKIREEAGSTYVYPPWPGPWNK